ncbi:MAG TPA: DUF1761 domain-containing protein [Candidatus Saccharimonadales bacterium]|nr:DUF1761 domain-containing protein [Candidatus Saccharimonadales bacterium]
MNVQVNLVGVLLAAVASMALGAVWYAKPVFGKMWLKLVGLSEKDQQANAAPALVQGFIMALLTAYVVAHVSYLSNQFFHHSFMQDAIATGFWLGLGISATTVAIHGAFERRPQRLVLLTVAHQLVGFIIIGAVIGAFQP